MMRVLFRSLCLWGFLLSCSVYASDPNLIGHWKLDGDATDDSGNAHHGTVYGDPNLLAEGHIDGAVQLDGLNDYITVLMDVSETAYGVSLWFKTSTADGGLFSVSYGEQSAENDRHLYLSGGNLHARIWDNETIGTTGLNLADDTWHQVVHSFGTPAGGQRLYVDGQLQAAGTKAVSDFDWSDRIHIGYSMDEASPYFTGSIDEVQLYNRMLIPVLEVSQNTYAFGALEDGTNPPDQTLTISNSGGGTLNWTVTDANALLFSPPNWLVIMPTSGMLGYNENEDVTLSVNVSGLSVGQYIYSFEVTDPMAENSPQRITVTLTIGGGVYLNGTEYPTIQAAIDAAVDGDTVIASPGVYVENINFGGKNIILASTNPEDPNIVESTIIDGNQSGSVVTFSGSETSACELRGFTITNGEADYGGGVYGNDTLATISNCTITGNKVNSGGGGGLSDCAGTITNCTISGNTVDSGHGGGLIWCGGTIINCTILDNSARHGGGGLCRCSGTIINCEIINNSALYNGGGLRGCDGTISNCTITGNTVTIYDGGGLDNCRGLIKNCTFFGNTAARYGGGVDSEYGTITNCILWGNSAGDAYDQIYNPTPTYNCIQDWAGGGTGNINSNPLFSDTSSTDPSDWDLHLTLWSPCIDAGTNSPPGGLPLTDIEGVSRPFDGDLDGSAVADMGSHEFHGFPEESCLYITQGLFNFTAIEAWNNPADRSLTVQNYGSQTLNWSLDLTDKPNWLAVAPASGSLNFSESEDITLSVDITGLSGGQYRADSTHKCN